MKGRWEVSDSSSSEGEDKLNTIVKIEKKIKEEIKKLPKLPLLDNENIDFSSDSDNDTPSDISFQYLQSLYPDPTNTPVKMKLNIETSEDDDDDDDDNEDEAEKTKVSNDTNLNENLTNSSLKNQETIIEGDTNNSSNLINDNDHLFNYMKKVKMQLNIETSEDDDDEDDDDNEDEAEKTKVSNDTSLNENLTNSSLKNQETIIEGETNNSSNSINDNNHLLNSIKKEPQKKKLKEKEMKSNIEKQKNNNLHLNEEIYFQSTQINPSVTNNNMKDENISFKETNSLNSINMSKINNNTLMKVNQNLSNISSSSSLANSESATSPFASADDDSDDNIRTDRQLIKPIIIENKQKTKEKENNKKLIENEEIHFQSTQLNASVTNEMNIIDNNTEIGTNSVTNELEISNQENDLPSHNDNDMDLTYLNSSLFLEELNLDEEDIYIFKCPPNIDLNQLIDKRFKMKSKNKININDVPMNINVWKWKTNNISLFLPSKKARAYKSKTIQLNGFISLENEISTTVKKDFNFPYKKKVEFPSDLKIRHPLLGSDYEKILENPSYRPPIFSITSKRKSLESQSISPTKKAKTSTQNNIEKSLKKKRKRSSSTESEVGRKLFKTQVLD